MNKQVIKILAVSTGLLALFFILPSSVEAALTVGSTSITTDSTLSLQGGNIGIGDLTPSAALVVGSDATAGVANGTGDLYVQNDLEVDGSITGTLKVSGGDGTMYNAVSGNLTAISGMTWNTASSALIIGNFSSSDGKLQLRQSGSSSVADSSTGTQLGIQVTDNGVVTSGYDVNFGQVITMNRRFATGGTIDTYGSYISVNGDNAGAGTSTTYGQAIEMTGAPDNAYGLYVSTTAGYAAVFTGGNVGVGTATPSDVLDVNSTNIRIRTASTPASNATCDTGEIAWGADYIYVCISTNTWRRSALTAY